MSFPIAQDREWNTVNQWWLTSPRQYTTATILVDQDGIIRLYLPGPEFHASTDPTHAACHAARDLIEQWIRKLMTEGPTPR
jgi:hypothetical protein